MKITSIRAATVTAPLDAPELGVKLDREKLDENPELYKRLGGYAYYPDSL